MAAEHERLADEGISLEAGEASGLRKGRLFMSPPTLQPL